MAYREGQVVGQAWRIRCRRLGLAVRAMFQPGWHLLLEHLSLGHQGQASGPRHPKLLLHPSQSRTLWSAPCSSSGLHHLAQAAARSMAVGWEVVAHRVDGMGRL